MDGQRTPRCNLRGFEMNDVYDENVARLCAFDIKGPTKLMV